MPDTSSSIAETARGELLRALAVLSEPPATEHRALAEALALGEPPGAAEHADLFVFQLYPYASVYLGAEGMLGGEARDRVAGFWRALALEPPAEPDHLATLLAFQARLGELEAAAGDEPAAARWRHARRAHLGEHLLSWLPPYLRRAREVGVAFYRSWADLLGAALAEEAEALGDAPPAVALADAPRLRDPRSEGAGGEALLADLLAPARSGIVLLRDDLERAARELGLGLRRAERRYALRALLAQDAAATLGWLAAEARRQASPEGVDERLAAGSFASFWRPRALATAELLDELAAEARERV